MKESKCGIISLTRVGACVLLVVLLVIGSEAQPACTYKDGMYDLNITDHLVGEPGWLLDKDPLLLSDFMILIQ